MINTAILYIIIFAMTWKHALTAILILYIGLIGVLASFDI